MVEPLNPHHLDPSDPHNLQSADEPVLERIVIATEGEDCDECVRKLRTPLMRIPGVRDVRETNICRISVHHDPRTGRVIAFAAIDNLWKGAASQAVQNLNVMFGLPEDEGIR